jgi:hypothetical protein
VQVDVFQVVLRGEEVGRGGPVKVVIGELDRLQLQIPEVTDAVW